MSNKPYIPILYPSMRYHKDGVRTIIVNSEEHEASIHESEPDTWFRARQFAPPPPPPPPERSFKECDETFMIHASQIEALTIANTELVKSNIALASQIADLTSLVNDLSDALTADTKKKGR